LKCARLVELEQTVTQRSATCADERCGESAAPMALHLASELAEPRDSGE